MPDAAAAVASKYKHTVLVSMPTYLDVMNAQIMHPLIRSTKRGDIAYDLSRCDTSANAHGMNRLWIEALEQRDKGLVSHFFMHHSDIVPEYWWLDKMMGIMERTGADVLSAVVPIKDAQGFTSTALDEPVGDVDPYWRVRRLTMREICKMEPTFTHPKLLLNDGFMLVNIGNRDVRWDDVWFQFEDKIIQHHGKRLAVCVPEDWNFSRKARAAGAKLWATREVALNHFGPAAFPNQISWGSAETDGIAHCPGVPDDVLTTMDGIEGWFTIEEGAALYHAAKKALELAPRMVEVGSFQGRSTYILGRACKEKGRYEDGSLAVVHAVDPHEGNLYASGQGVKMPPSFKAWEENMIRTGVRAHTWPEVMKSTDVNWFGGGISLLFIDGLHDYENVSKDFEHFYKWMVPGGYVCFHDYADSDPDVKRFVDEEIGTGALESESLVGSLRICRVPVGAKKPLSEMRV